MDTTNESLQARSLSKVPYIAGALFLLAAVIGFAFWQYRVQQHSARVAAAQKEFDRYNNARKTLRRLYDQLDKDGHHYSDLWDSGRKAGSKRHDLAVGATGDSSVLDAMLAQAKIEANDVDSLDLNLQAQQTVLLQIADTLESVYGDSAVSQFRSDALKWIQLSQQSVTAWSSAIREIRDSLQIDSNGGDGPDEDESSGRFYNDSDEFEAQAQTQSSVVSHDEDILLQRLKSDLARTKKALQQAQQSQE